MYVYLSKLVWDHNNSTCVVYTVDVPKLYTFLLQPKPVCQQYFEYLHVLCRYYRLFYRTDVPMAGVEKRLTGVETRLTGVETRLTGVETRLSGVETRLRGGDTTEGVETRLAGVEN